MPGLTGIDVLRQAREICPRAVRLLLTGYSDLNAIIGSINEGEIFRFVTKPWINKELRDTVAAATRSARVEPEVVAASEDQSTDVAAAAEQGQTGVLLLEEDPEIAKMIRETLNVDRPVYCAISVDHALALLERHRVGILITELIIGGEPVTAMISALRQNHPTLVTIVMTDRADANMTIDLINYGQIYRLLQKPINTGLLRGVINIASRRFEALKKNPEQVRRFVAEAPPPRIVEKRSLFDRIRKLLLPN